MSLRVALVHNLKLAAPSSSLPEDYFSECDSAKTVQAIADALASGGHTVLPVEADGQLAQWLADHPVDCVFNIAEGFEGEAREARVPALLELLEIPYTGSGALALTLALDKYRSKLVFKALGIPTPNFQLFSLAGEALDKRLHFPLIVKPNREGSAKGIWASSVVWNEEALYRQVAEVYRRYHQEVLVEEFIEGTELTVGILGPDGILPILEIDFSNCQPSGESFYSWRMKEFQGDERQHLNPRFFCPARIGPEKTQAVGGVALKAAQALACRDFSRVDIRLSSDGIPFVLEVNPLPGLDPIESNYPIMAAATGISYEALIHRILGFAFERSWARLNPSLHSSSPENRPSAKARAPRSLPDSGAKAHLSPGKLKVAPGAVAPRPVRAAGNGTARGSSKQAPFDNLKARQEEKVPTRGIDPKEENLGR